MTNTQKGVLTGMVSGMILALAIVGFAAFGNPFSFPAELGVGAALSVAIESLLLPVLTLSFCIARMARHRFFTPADIDGAGLTEGTERAKILQSLLQNTLEQTVLAAGVYLAWAVLMPATTLSALPLAAIAFALGRGLFFISYEKGATARSIGFTLSFYPSLVMLFISLVAALWHLIG